MQYYYVEESMSANLIIVNNFFVQHIRTLVNPIIKVMLMTDKKHIYERVNNKQFILLATCTD